MKPCPTCSGFVKDGGSRCAVCTSRTRAASRARNGRTDQHYASTAWRTARALKLRRTPRCEELGCNAEATVVDHDPPRRQLLEAGVKNPDHQRWLRSLCKPHHDRKTATVDGGFGRRADVRIGRLDLIDSTPVQSCDMGVSDPPATT